MRKLLTIIFVLLFASSAFAAHPGPAQWSLAGVASWAQILTASGTATPSDTAAFTIGDFYAQNTAGSSTVTLYRLCASGSTSVWNPLSGSGSAGGAILPALEGNSNLFLRVATNESGVYWSEVVASIDPTVSAHMADETSPHGVNQSIGNNIFWGDYGYQGRRILWNPDVELNLYDVAIASYASVFSEDTYLAQAPASSTRAVGVVASFVSYLSGENPATDTIFIFSGETMVRVASDSATINGGDWIITSDTAPGHVMRASVEGDQPLPSEEAQRAIGYSNYPQWYSEEDLATYTWVILKGNR